MMRAESHATGEEFVKSCDPALWRFPRPVEEIATTHSLRVVEAPAYVNLDHGMIVGDVILISKQRKSWEKRLTIAHELGHYVLGTGIGVAEAECTQFGAALLMPMDDVITEVRAWGTEGTHSVADLAYLEGHRRCMSHLVWRYGVGYKALVWAMADYGLIRGVPAWHGFHHIDALMEEYRLHLRGQTVARLSLSAVDIAFIAGKEVNVNMKKCPNCDTEARHEDAAFCYECGNPLVPNSCSVCHTILEIDEAHCYRCGGQSTFMRDGTGKFGIYPDEDPF